MEGEWQFKDYYPSGCKQQPKEHTTKFELSYENKKS